jgi:hypothetical protein
MTRSAALELRWSRKPKIHMQRATMRGLIVTDHLDRWPEALGALGELWAADKLKYDETDVTWHRQMTPQGLPAPQVPVPKPTRLRRWRRRRAPGCAGERHLGA